MNFIHTVTLQQDKKLFSRLVGGNIICSSVLLITVIQCKFSDLIIKAVEEYVQVFYT